MKRIVLTKLFPTILRIILTTFFIIMVSTEVCELPCALEGSSSGDPSVVPSFLSSYRPRGSLARALYSKYLSDMELCALDKNTWYKCDLDNMPSEISSRFVQLAVDDTTEEFLKQSEEKSDWILTQIWHYLAKAFLRLFMSNTSINGWLQRGSMFVLSTEQFLKLLGQPEWRADSLLDLGAGDGEVTAHLAPRFSNIYTTELSNTMQGLLRRKGYHIMEIDKWQSPGKYDMIACLNLLDRCDKPLNILEDMRMSLKPGGFVLLGLVLPFSAYVEANSSRNYKPGQLLPISGKTFEDQVFSIVNEMIIPNKYELVSWTRVPYLCEGDLEKSYYWLDDVILLLKSSKPT